MKIAAVSMVKNESDIIELFIRINSRFFDAIYILDHQSTDSTPEIIRLMKESGFNVFYTILKDTIYNQSKITSDAVNQISRMNLYDYIMPIDADEFIPDIDSKLIKDFLNSNKSDFNVGYIPWKTYYPINNQYYESRAPLYENFIPRASEKSQFYKIIISNEFGKTCNVAMGNHDASNLSESVKYKKKLIPSYLIHIPVRNKQQIISKVILGSHAFKLKKDRTPGEGFHWDQIAKKIKEMNYNLTDQMIFHIAANYATPHSDWVTCINNPHHKINEPERIGRKSDKIVFKNLATIDLLKNFDSRIEELTSIIVNQSNK